MRKDRTISLNALMAGLASIAKVKARSEAQKSLMGRVMFFAEQLPPVTPLKSLGEEMRIIQKGITDEKVLLGFNMAVALCNKHLGGDDNE